MTVKGKAEPVSVFALAGSKRHASRAQASSELPIVGRRAELETIDAKLDETLAGRGQIVGIAAEAGMGKSRLAAEFARTARARGIVVAVGECQSYGTNTGYFVWRDGLGDAVPPRTTACPRTSRCGRWRAELAAIDPALVPRAPLLGGLLDLPIPDNDLTASFDAKLRKTSLEGLLAECLRARAGEAPLVVVLEDCHWLDPLSRDLLEVLARALASLSVMLVLAYRPSTDVGGGLGIENLPHFGEIALAELDDENAAQLIRSKLGQMLGAEAEAPAALVELVTARAQGNPFYIEELLNYIRSQGVDPQDESALKKLELPESLHSLILSRIDKLERGAAAHAQGGERPRARVPCTDAARRLSRARRVRARSRSTCERSARATSSTSTRKPSRRTSSSTSSRRRSRTRACRSRSASMLHERVGGYIERTEADAIDRATSTCSPTTTGTARTWRRSASTSAAPAMRPRPPTRTRPRSTTSSAWRRWWSRARASTCCSSSARCSSSSATGAARSRSTARRWCSPRTSATTTPARRARRRSPRWRASRAATTRRSSASIARRASSRSAGDESGVGKVLHLVGTVAAQRGDYAKAVENYEASLAIRERVGDKASMASLLSNLGIVAEYRATTSARARSTSARSRCARRSATAGPSATRRTTSA